MMSLSRFLYNDSKRFYASFQRVSSIVSDVTIIGAGVSGLASIQRLRNDGFTVNAIESGHDVGGTWYWNRYPGAVCDIASMEYSFEFDSELQQDWNWTDQYSAQPQILSYLNHVADKHDLRKHIHFGQTVEECRYSESDSKWIIKTNNGNTYISKVLLLATGVLSKPNEPYYEGLQQYKGDILYTSKWPQYPVNVSDKKVAIIGTGSSGIQCIPKIAEMAKHLTVYQRTAQYVVPLLNKTLSVEQQQTIKNNYDELREKEKNTGMAIDLDVNDTKFDEMTKEQYENGLLNAWNNIGGLSLLVVCSDLMVNKDADIALAEFIRNRIREIVKDEDTAERLCPTQDQLYSCKRPLFGTNYFETYNRSNVELVCMNPKKEESTPIKEITSNSIITSDNIERECDVLIFATGFDAMTGAILNMNIKGINDETIQENWKDGPKTYLGLQTVGFPNMFMITGPHTPSVFTNMIPSIEYHVNWIADLLVYMKNNNLNCVEPLNDSQKKWTQLNYDTAQQTLFGSPACNSWYLGSNIPGKSRHFIPSLMGYAQYAETCNNIAKEDYIGFDFNLQSRKTHTR